MAGPGELRALTGLRFVAAFWVFLYHVQIRAPLVESGPGIGLLGQGAVGMTLFFLLSGFILAWRYRDGAFSPRTFLLNRAARLYPVYLLAALLTLPGFFGPLAGEDVPALRMLLQGAVLVLTGALMLQAWFPQLFVFWNNSASWSLSAEAFFYAVFALVFARLRGLGPAALIAGGLGAYALAVLPGLAHTVFPDRPAPGLQIVYAMPVFRLGEFLCGVCLCLALIRFGRPALPGWLAGAAALALGLWLAREGAVVAPYVGHNWIAVPAIGLCVAALAGGAGGVLATRPAVWLGRVSYCFYSFQLPVLWLTAPLRDAWGLSAPAWAGLALALLLAVSALGYHLVEEPARAWLRARGQTRHAAPGIAAAPAREPA